MALRSTLVFLVGLTAGAAIATAATQERRLPGMNGINHLAFVTPHYDEMLAFYTETLGFPEAFTIRNAAGQPTLTYLQASRNTFVELMPAAVGRAAAFTHFGIHVDDVQMVAAKLRERGMDVGVPRIIGSGSLTVAITDPDGNRLEVSELGPDAPARKAMNAWK
ncbi:MAG: VOC family protein [Acidobacteriota bacterium]